MERFKVRSISTRYAHWTVIKIYGFLAKRALAEYGEVASANVIMDRATGHSKGFGFVEMDNDEEALKAIDELDECEYDNSQIVVKKARPKEEGERRSGGFKGGNRSDRGGDRGGYRKSRYDD